MRPKGLVWTHRLMAVFDRLCPVTVTFDQGEGMGFAPSSALKIHLAS
jgi:hypothetical protein